MAIDNGADAFVGTGVHTLRGVEIYKGKPIFYDVSNFFYQEGPAIYITDPSQRPPAHPSYGWSGAASGPWDGGEHFADDKEVLLTTSRYEAGKLVEVRLYPVDLGIDGMRPISRAGNPTTPSPEQALKILKHVQDMSKAFGTKISIENNIQIRMNPMRGLTLILIGSLLALFAIPARADEAQESSFNFHLGGGLGVPLNPTAHFAGLSGTAQVGGGPNLTKHQSIVGEYMWQGLPPNHNAIMGSFCLVTPVAPAAPCPINATDNLFSLTANYMFHSEGERFGYYVIGGGGWYYRFAQFQNFTVGPGTVCSPPWGWWGYRCLNGFVSTTSVQNGKGVSSGGVNGGFGITFRLTQSGLRFYLEARYHYSPQGGRVSTQIVPVTLGIRW